MRKKRNKGPNKLKCIQKFCLECAGESTKEVSLCHLSDCPLWEYRTGNHITSPVYKKRMETALKNYPEDFEEARKLGVFPHPLVNIEHGEEKVG